MAIYVPPSSEAPGVATPTVGALTVNEIVARVKRQFGDESSVQITDTDIFRWINDAQRDIALHADILQAKGTADIVLGQSEYSLPLDVLTIRSVRYNGRKLQGYSAQEAEEYIERGTTETGTPSAFWTWAQRINIYPTPDAAVPGGLSIYYTRQPTPVATLTDLPELPAQYHNRIVEFCLQQAYELDENWQAAESKGAQFKSGVQEMKDNSTWDQRDYYPSITSLPEDVTDWGQGGMYW